jgi:ABC-type multidrug transport system ATPase subunit
MKLDIESSICGLWLSPGRAGYLSSWFPRLRNKNGNFIPISPGLNVFYGRNGAGKTQILQAIAHTAEFKMSSYEGFVLKKPKVSGLFFDYPDPAESYVSMNYDKEYSVFGVSPWEMLARYKAESREDTWLGWTEGFVADAVEGVNEILVLGIFQEFINSGHALITRSPVKESPWADEASKMNSPESIEVVPVLLPSELGELTRKHAKEIQKSFNEFMAKMNEEFNGGDDPDLTVDENNERYSLELEQKGILFEEWVSSWSWSPLINLRNFGFNDGFSFVDDGAEGTIFDSESMPLFLPALISYRTSREYQEFKSSHSPRVSLSLTKESTLWDGNSTEKELSEGVDLGKLTSQDIDEENKKSGERTKEELESYKILLSDYVSQLRQKLNFLPNFRSLGYMESPFSEHPWLVMNEGIPASKGSAAERRWLQLARQSLRESTQWVVIDEPESGMHRSAEAELARNLSSFHWNQGNIIVVATHSPEFLDIPTASVNHVENGRVYKLTTIDRENLVALGLRPADLLGQVRTFLLVEGEHERIIFETLFKEELQRAGCKIIVARGGKNMKDVFESQMIFNFSDAVIISLLDNIESETINSVWREARQLAERGKLIEAGQYVRSSLPGKNHSENTFLSQFLTLALANGQHERVEVWGLSKADIVLYFNPTNFGIKRSWNELLGIHSDRDPSFKDWANKKYGADFSVKAVEQAAKSCAELPDEFINLVFRISEISKSTEIS